MGTDRQQGNQPVKCAGQYLPLMISNRYTIIECRESPARTSPSTRWQIRVSAGQIGPYLPAENADFLHTARLYAILMRIKRASNRPTNVQTKQVKT